MLQLVTTALLSVTCDEVKNMYQENSCCESPENLIGLSSFEISKGKQFVMPEVTQFTNYEDGEVSGSYTLKKYNASSVWKVTNGATTLTKDLSCKLAYMEAGDPNGRLVAFFHGWPGVFTEYTPLIDEMMKTHPEYHYVSYALPGHYPSEPIMEGETILTEFANMQSYAVLYDQHMRSIYAGNDTILVGSDWAGLIIEMFPVKFPEHYANAKLVFTDLGPYMHLLVNSGGSMSPDPAIGISEVLTYNSVKGFWYFHLNSGMLDVRSATNNPSATNLHDHLYATSAWWLGLSASEPSRPATCNRLFELERDWNPKMQLSESFKKTLCDTFSIEFTDYPKLRTTGNTTVYFSGMMQGINQYVNFGNNPTLGKQAWNFIDPDKGGWAIGLYNPAAPFPPTNVLNDYVTIIGADDGNIPSESWDPATSSPFHPNRKGHLYVPSAGKYSFMYESKMFADFVWEKLM